MAVPPRVLCRRNESKNFLRRPEHVSAAKSPRSTILALLMRYTSYQRSLEVGASAREKVQAAENRRPTAIFQLGRRQVPSFPPLSFLPPSPPPELLLQVHSFFPPLIRIPVCSTIIWPSSLPNANGCNILPLPHPPPSPPANPTTKRSYVRNTWRTRARMQVRKSPSLQYLSM